MSNKDWNIIAENHNVPLNVVLFVSRKKDNKEIKDFKERRQAFLTNESKDSNVLKTKFINFVDEGEYGELSRMYYSINSRKSQEVYKEFLHFLIDNPDFNLCSAGSKLAGIAMKHKNAETKHWLFDFDNNDFNKVKEFMSDIHNCDASCQVDYFKTPHGFAVIADHGFDTRELLEKWGEDVTLKRDDLLCCSWYSKTWTTLAEIFTV